MSTCRAARFASAPWAMMLSPVPGWVAALPFDNTIFALPWASNPCASRRRFNKDIRLVPRHINLEVPEQQRLEHLVPGERAKVEDLHPVTAHEFLQRAGVAD